MEQFIQLSLPLPTTYHEAYKWLRESIVNGELPSYSPGVRLALCETEPHREVLTRHVAAIGGWVEDGGSPHTCYVRLPEDLPIREWEAEMLERRREQWRVSLERLQVSHPLAFTAGGQFSVYLMLLHYSRLGAYWHAGSSERKSPA